jgi:hypothetical protein
MSWVSLGMGRWATIVSLYCSTIIVVAVTVAHIGLEFDYLGAKSPLSIYKQREGNVWESSCV